MGRIEAPEGWIKSYQISRINIKYTIHIENVLMPRIASLLYSFAILQTSYTIIIKADKIAVILYFKGCSDFSDLYDNI